MSFKSRKFFKSSRSGRILELAISKPTDLEEATVTKKYEFNEDSKDPWHSYKLWRSGKNDGKEIEVTTKNNVNVPEKTDRSIKNFSESSSSFSGSNTRSNLNSFTKSRSSSSSERRSSESSIYEPRSSESSIHELGSSESRSSKSSSPKSRLLNENTMKDISRGRPAVEIYTENEKVMNKDTDNQNFEAYGSNPTEKRGPITILHDGNSIECSRRKIRLWDKKDRCIFCNSDVTNFSRHIFRNHNQEETVKKILSFPKYHPNRKIFINSLRKDGNFSLYAENKIRAVQRPSTSTNANLNFLPCKFCKGLYKKKSLKKHLKICKMRDENLQHGSRYCSEALTMLAFEESKKPYLNRLRLKSEVFGSMHADRIALEGMKDPIACQYAENYLKQHRRPHIKHLVSNKIRELGRLLIQLKDTFGIKSILDSLKPEHFEKVVTAARIISGYNESTNSFNAPSLALHFRTNLVQVCSTAESMILKKNPLIKVDNQKETLKNIKYFKSLVASNWKFEMGSLALKDLTEKHSTTIQRLPLTKDLILFNKYCYEIAEKAANELESNMNNKNAFKRLSETLLALTISINRKRVGDVQYLYFETYNQERSDNDCLDMLTDSEKEMTKFFKRVVTIGKGSRAVPILFPKKIQNYITLLLRIRKETTFVPQENPYLFALTGSSSKWIDGPSTLRKYSKSCGAENPETLTSSRLRKQIATVLQILNLSEVEMEQIAKFMGHTKKTHEEFYRLPQELFQTSKVAKLLLMTMVKGISMEEQGKTIDDIDFELGTWDGNESITQNQDASPVAVNEEIEESPIDPEIATVSTKGGESSFNNKKIQLRGTWNIDQKKIMLKYFKNHIAKKIPPKKAECLEFREKNLKEFESKSWLQIKTFVYNSYRVI